MSTIICPARIHLLFSLNVYCFSSFFLPKFLSTETKITITHTTPKMTSTISATLNMSNCAITSANDESPKDNADPGMILGVGLGVGTGVGVGSAVAGASVGGAVAAVGVGVSGKMYPKSTFEG